MLPALKVGYIFILPNEWYIICIPAGLIPQLALCIKHGSYNKQPFRPSVCVLIILSQVFSYSQQCVVSPPLDVIYVSGHPKLTQLARCEYQRREGRGRGRALREGDQEGTVQTKNYRALSVKYHASSSLSSSCGIKVASDIPSYMSGHPLTGYLAFQGSIYLYFKPCKM